MKNFYDFTVDDFELVDYNYTKLDKKSKWLSDENNICS